MAAQRNRQVAVFDLRSDTVTQPTDEMRQAMAAAQVGDDVYGEDPTVKELETAVANLLNKEDGLFLPSGSMSNLVAVLAQCQKGDEILLGDQSHIYLFEQGASATLASVHPRSVSNLANGAMEINTLEAAIRPGKIHFPRTRLLCIENTHNRCGGRVLPLQFLNDVKELCKTHKIKSHLDGARLWNAALATDTPIAKLCNGFDSVAVCLSKGLGAPAGSVLCGSIDFINEARRWRKALGGGMRQVGVLAAAGLVALKTMVMRLADDHATAKLLAEKLSSVPGLAINPSEVETNIVLATLDVNFPIDEIVTHLKQDGILVNSVDNHQLRFVTHYQINKSDIDEIVNRIYQVLTSNIYCRSLGA